MSMTSPTFFDPYVEGMPIDIRDEDYVEVVRTLCYRGTHDAVRAQILKSIPHGVTKSAGRGLNPVFILAKTISWEKVDPTPKEVPLTGAPLHLCTGVRGTPAGQGLVLFLDPVQGIAWTDIGPTFDREEILKNVQPYWQPNWAPILQTVPGGPEILHPYAYVLLAREHGYTLPEDVLWMAVGRWITGVCDLG